MWKGVGGKDVHVDKLYGMCANFNKLEVELSLAVASDYIRRAVTNLSLCLK